jgi:HD-GYP domain-containing protein (c-di-GMP phosphodiesterase class II)
MLRKPRIEDFKRKIKIVFFDQTDSALDEFKQYFKNDYFEINGIKNFNEISNKNWMEMPDLIVCTDNFTILSNSIEKFVYYIKYNDFYNKQKEISVEIKRHAYKNYLDKIKHQIALMIGKKGNPNKGELVKEIVNLLDLKDKYLRDHSIRVAVYSIMIGKKLKLDENKLETLKYAALLHDIGKLGLPSVIINKPKELTKEEMKIYEYHAYIGRYILDFDLFDGIKKSILYHHEKMDGTGYFKKQSDKEIPLYARIIAVTNTFDLLITSNFYANRMTKEEAIQYFSKYTKQSKRTPFDYRIVKIFLKCLDEIEFSFSDMNLILKNM